MQIFRKSLLSWAADFLRSVHIFSVLSWQWGNHGPERACHIFKKKAVHSGDALCFHHDSFNVHRMSYNLETSQYCLTTVSLSTCCYNLHLLYTMKRSSRQLEQSEQFRWSMVTLNIESIENTKMKMSVQHEATEIEGTAPSNLHQKDLNFPLSIPSRSFRLSWCVSFVGRKAWEHGWDFHRRWKTVKAESGFKVMELIESVIYGSVNSIDQCFPLEQWLSSKQWLS